MTIKITNGLVCEADCSSFFAGDVYIKNGKITSEIIPSPDKIIDAHGGYVIPGFVDIHTHGNLGKSYDTRDNINDIIKLQVGLGVTTVVPTVAGLPLETLIAVLSEIADYKNTNTLGSVIGGIHIEGPFISEEKKGAIIMQDIKCNTESFNKLFDACHGLLKIMTIAPEVNGALDVIRLGSRLGVRMSLGHSMATYEEAMKGIEAGATGSTHTFNAMRSYDHREPGILGAVLTDDRIICEAICDLVHISAATIKLIFNAKGADNFICISDSTPLSYLPDGTYNLNGIEETVGGGVIRLKNGTISGSCSPLADNARKMRTLDISPTDIVKICSLNPAKAVGLDNEIGAIKPGLNADIIITDDKFNVRSVIKCGEIQPRSADMPHS